MEKSPNERYTEWAQKIQDLTDLLDGLEMLRQDVKPYEKEYRATFDIFINRNIESFRRISNQDDLKSALYEKGLPLKTAWEIKSLGIVGISQKKDY